MLPGDPSLLSRVGITSTPLVSCVHVTPIRASRALGVRFLSTKFGVSLDRFTLAVKRPPPPPPTMTPCSWCVLMGVWFGVWIQSRTQNQQT